MPGYQGEVAKGLAHLKSVEIFRIWKVFGSVISFGSGQNSAIGNRGDIVGQAPFDFHVGFIEEW